MTKIRLDVLLVDKGLAETQEKARRLILAGLVKVKEAVVDKPGSRVNPDSYISVTVSPAYVSRGAEKLWRALEVFGVNVADRVALDAGASTGGFTEILLKRGARRVIAVDVGYGQLAWKLRQDPRVDVIDRLNVRYLKPSDLPEQPDLVTADLSFISLGKVAEPLLAAASPDADFIFLIKPQFEAVKSEVGKGGIIREAAQHVCILKDVISHLKSQGFVLNGLTYSPLTGADGNIEFLAHLRHEKLETKNKKPKTKNLKWETKNHSRREKLETKNQKPKTENLKWETKNHSRHEKLETKNQKPKTKHGKQETVSNDLGKLI
ncbi:MAG: TlyA family RNA methyltransferase, partial [Actinomycetota bacterium]